MKILLIFTFLLSCANAGTFSKAQNGDYISISGKVDKVRADYFILVSNGKRIHVEMDDYDWDSDGYKVVKGDRVVVSGFIDQDYLEKKKIEAGSVYVKNLDTYFFANSSDEEDIYTPDIQYSMMKKIPDSVTYRIKGKVVQISNDSFVVDSGLNKWRIDTNYMSFNPLDDVGFTQVDINDKVTVTGIPYQSNLFQNRLQAKYVVEL